VRATLSEQRQTSPSQRHRPSRARAVGIDSPLVDAQQAARMLAVPASWLLAQARRGAIPHHRLGHYVRFDVDELADWLRERRPTTSAAGRS
jgi:excisionase family DNA binding protein